MNDEPCKKEKDEFAHLSWEVIRIEKAMRDQPPSMKPIEETTNEEYLEHMTRERSSSYSKKDLEDAKRKRDEAEKLMNECLEKHREQTKSN